MAIRIVRLGAKRLQGEGLRIGTARRPPRGVKKRDYARLDYYDAWLPELAPSQKLASWAMSRPFTPERWKKFARDYRREMKAPQAERLLDLLARLSRQTNFSVGCYCEDESRCHRSILHKLLDEHGARLAK
ncbi:MAG: DUF488 domain-containing protein [Betaproteobacteria bacterium]